MDMFEIINQQVKEWFEKQNKQLISSSDMIPGWHHWEICDGKYVTTLYIKYDPNGALWIMQEVLGETGLGYLAIPCSELIYEISNPEFPENMFQDIERIIQDKRLQVPIIDRSKEKPW